MKTYRLHILLVFSLLTSVSSTAQDMLGTTLGNYAGVNSIQLNPSALHNSKSYLDIQLVGLGVFLENNALYMSKNDYRFTNFFKAGYQYPMHSEGYGTEQRIFYTYKNRGDKSAFVNLRVNGPGAMVIWGKHAFALSTSMRAVFSLTNVPYDVVNFSYLGLNYRPQQNINYNDTRPFRAAGMVWGEIGISYAYRFFARGMDVWSAGITVKRLFGVSGMYAKVNNINYTVLNDSTVNVKNLDAEMGIALPVNSNANTANLNPLIKGGGFGFDIGVTYQRLSRYHQEAYFNTLCAQPYEDYLYRVSVGLVDLGRIKFKDNASKMVFDNKSSYWENVTHMPFHTIGNFLDTLSYQFYGDKKSAYAANSFNIWLPSALSIQFDYHLMKSLYLNTNLIYGFPLAGGAIVRPAELSFTPRYETSLFEVSLPVSLYNWTLPRIGLALRVYGLTIGTDKLGGFFNYSQMTGMDFYFSLKLFFSKGNCRIKGPVHCGTEARKKIKY
ncbi:MAG: DUF5723 family protein [Bacteroidota bacterium]